MGNLLILFIASLGLCLFVALLYVLYNYWWVTHRVQFIMSSQGIRGPPYEFIHGNNKQILQMQKEAYSKLMALTHDIFPRVLPHVYSYIKKYGKNYLSWNGVQAQLVITDPELQGDSLVTSESEKRARQRKLANYAFHGESLKNMIPAMIASVGTMLEKWKDKEGKEMEVFQEFRFLTSEVTSRTAFGSSYLEGEKIFDMLTKLTLIIGRIFYKANIPIIGKFWKSVDEIESNKLEKMILDSVMKIVKQREEKVMTGEVDSFGHDFLGLLVNAYHDPDEKNRLSIQDVVGECKTFYFAGQETTNSLLEWTTLLLAIYTDWQDKARAEVVEVFGNQNPNSEGITKLKTITMIINETLRLYPPINSVVRKAVRDVQLGNLVLPNCLDLNIRFIALHHDPALWGDDVHLFKPERFAEGIAKATNNNAVAFMPFGMGHRSCVGMSFSITETKIALSMILQRYTFTLSPTYVHAPLPNLSLKPQHGLHLLFHSLD
ncbi:cytochrome P450 CYP749A22 isoform X2 [Gossypium hirsutum]|uniref:Cytochrome P450 CYP749A22 isoform X2 n=1 Tax=Gossypium hirsutum TaxID=3635 RepID=A0ABM2ZDU0_GOSHI|nr:cytochrome P450 CYP749A22-like isoform X2 [Gossypium hirsutum]